MFGFSDRIVSLETTLAAYEKMSREMVAKLESAVTKISDNITNSNQVITAMLIKHDERIEQAAETHRETIEKIKELKHDLVSDVKYMRSDVESLRREVISNKETISRFFDDKLAYTGKEFDDKLTRCSTEFSGKISGIQAEIEVIRQPTLINSGKTSIIVMIITAILTGFVSFYFGEQQAAHDQSSDKITEKSLFGSKLNQNNGDYNNRN